MSGTVEYHVGAELPSLELTWKDNDGDIIDFSSGYTFSLRIQTDPVTEKTDNITGAATDPNVTVAWDAGELDSLTGGKRYKCQLWARRTSDNKDRTLEFTLFAKTAVTPP